MIAAIEKLKPKWALPLKYVLAGYTEVDRREELWQTAAASHLADQHGALAGYVVLDARIREIPPLQASLKALQRAMALDGPPQYTVSETARWLALEFASGRPRLLNRTQLRTEDHDQAAQKIGSDPELPEELRAIWTQTAR